MFAKISLTAAFFLMAAPPVACASNWVASKPPPAVAKVFQPVGIVVAQDADSNSAASDDNGNDNDNDSNDNADDNQNDNDQDQNTAGNDQNAQPSDNDNNNASDAQQQVPQGPLLQQLNPNQ